MYTIVNFSERLRSVLNERYGEKKLNLISKEIGLPYHTIRKWVRNERQPTAGHMCLLCNALKLPMDFFLMEEVGKAASTGGMRPSPGGR